MPNSAVTTSSPYGITKDPNVINTVRAMPSNARDRVVEALDSLQSDPRPEGHHLTRAHKTVLFNWIVQTGGARYLLVYLVDDETKNVYVVAVTQIHFS